MHRHIVRTLLLAGLTLIACGEDDSQTVAPPGDNGIHGTMTATIKGEQRNMTIVSLSAEPGKARSGQFTIEARTRDATIWMRLSYVSGPGSYPLGVNTDTNAGGMVTVMTSDDDDMPVSLASTSGTVVVGTRTEARITGTFSFSATSFLFPGVAFNASNGVFDITMDRGLPALPTGIPNSGSLRVDNVECTATQVLGTKLEDGRYELQVSCGYDMTVWIKPRAVIGTPGNYEVPADVELSAFHDNTWYTSIDGPPTGFLNVLTVESDRVVGTFGGTLTREGGEGTITIQLGTVNSAVE